MSTRTPAASAVRTQRRARSGYRALLGRVSASALNSERAPVADDALLGLLGLVEQRARQLGEVELRQRRLAALEAVVQERLQRLRVALGHAGLARVLVDVGERLRGDRVGLRTRGVDRADAEVGRDLQPVAGGRRGVQ